MNVVRKSKTPQIPKNQKLDSLLPSLTKENKPSLTVLLNNHQHLTAMSMKLNQESNDILKSYMRTFTKKD